MVGCLHSLVRKDKEREQNTSLHGLRTGKIFDKSVNIHRIPVDE